jgi:cell wall assembly regulator SMI1
VTAFLLQLALYSIDAWYLANVPAIHATLRPGATDAELDALEQQTGLTLPEAFRTLYRWHDGQEVLAGFAFGLDFMPLNAVSDIWELWWGTVRDSPESDIRYESVSHPVNAIQNRYSSPRWLGFLNDGGGNYVGLDFAPGPAGTPGQVMTFGRDETEKCVLADSLDAFLREYLSRLEAGRVSVIGDDDFGDEVWHVRLHDAAGQHQEGYLVLADLFPGFGAAPDDHQSRP